MMDASYYKKKYEPINGKWLIKETLGTGSYGTVFRIEYEDILGKKTEAALKVITIPKSEQEIESVRECLHDENSLNQYFTNMATKIAEEFDVMSQLKGNTHIVSYEEHDIIPHENGIGYDILIRMELLKPLNKLTSAMTEQEVIKLGIDICRALELCQKYHVVHRDIKPENIFISPSGDYKLGDFGVAKTMKSELTVMTVAGTYTYMAPELKKGEECSANVDIYSLGMVMYRLLNFNREPFLPLPPEMFTFDQREQALINRMKGLPLPKPANASEKLTKIILKACEYSPKKRYQNPRKMRLDLEDLLKRELSEARHPAEVLAVNDVTSQELIKNELSDETAGTFSTERNETPIECSFDGTVGLFTEQVKEQVVEEDSDETVGLFSEKKVPPVNKIKENSIMPKSACVLPGNKYKVIVHKATETPFSYDIAVDGVVYRRNIKGKYTEVLLSGGEHQISIQLQALTTFVSRINPNNIAPDTQKKLEKWIKLYSVGIKVTEPAKITFANDLTSRTHDSGLKIVSVETNSGVESFADLDSIISSEDNFPIEKSVDTPDSKNVDDIIPAQPSETYSVTLKRHYLQGDLAGKYAIDIMVDGTTVATEQKGDYILVLNKGMHHVEIGYASVHTDMARMNPSVFNRKIHFTATSQGELYFGIDKATANLKPFRVKGGISKIVVKW